MNSYTDAHEHALCFSTVVMETGEEHHGILLHVEDHRPLPDPGLPVCQSRLTRGRQFDNVINSLIHNTHCAEEAPHDRETERPQRGHSSPADSDRRSGRPQGPLRSALSPNHTIPITPHSLPTHSPHCAGKAVSSGQIPSSLPEAIEVPRMADGEKGCESCLATVATRWYQWGPAHEHCRLCNFCYTYWRKYGGLKLPTRWGEFSRPLCAPLVTPLSPDHTPQRPAKRGLG